MPLSQKNDGVNFNSDEEILEKHLVEHFFPMLRVTVRSSTIINQSVSAELRATHQDCQRTTII